MTKKTSDRDVARVMFFCEEALSINLAPSSACKIISDHKNNLCLDFVQRVRGIILRYLDLEETGFGDGGVVGAINNWMESELLNEIAMRIDARLHGEPLEEYSVRDKIQKKEADLD